MSCIYFVRHGENLANLTKEFSYKKVDYDLTRKGILQAQQTGEHFSRKPAVGIYTSPLKRCTQTAAIIAQQTGLAVHVAEELREVNVGDLEGQPVTQKVWDEHNAIIKSWCEGSPEASFPGGENQHQLARRFSAVLQRILAAANQQDVIVVGHGGQFTFGLPMLVPGLAIDHLLQKPNHNCSISRLDLRLESGQIHGRLLAWAQTDHLSGAAADFVHGVPQAGELSR